MAEIERLQGYEILPPPEGGDVAVLILRTKSAELLAGVDPQTLRRRGAAFVKSADVIEGK